LPPEVLDRAESAIVKALTRDELLRALEVSVEVLLAHSIDVPAAAKLDAELRSLCKSDAVR